MNKTIPIMCIVFFFTIISILLIYPQFEDNRKRNLVIREVDGTIPGFFHMSDQLKGIFHNCNCQEDPERTCEHTLIHWQNSTHYIDNNVCEFVPISVADK